MRKKIIFLLIVAVSFSEDRYESAMQRGIDIFNSAESREDYIKSSNFFYRIYQAKKNSWLPGYYYSFANTKISFFEKESFIKDEYLDKAFEIISVFDSVGIEQLDSLSISEIYTLKGMIYSAKIMIDPMTRGKEFGLLSGEMIQNAINFYSGNPRPYLISGQMKFYTPAAFGGGIDKAMPLLKKSIDYYEQFSAKKFWPDWGYEEAQKKYRQGLNKLENKK